MEQFPHNHNENYILDMMQQVENTRRLREILDEEGDEDDPNREREVGIIDRAGKVVSAIESHPDKVSDSEYEELEADLKELASRANTVAGLIGAAGGLPTIGLALSSIHDYEAAGWIGGYTVGLMAAVKAVSMIYSAFERAKAKREENSFHK